MRTGAANRFPDKCDSDPEGTRALNIAASASLAKICAAKSIFLIYISTDYVFPGTEGDAPYEADSTPKPPNLYGETKYEGERAVLREYESAGKPGWGVVLRVPVLYGEAESPSESAVNVLMDAVWKAQDRNAGIKMDHWAIRYPTNTEDVGRVCHGTPSHLSCPLPLPPPSPQSTDRDNLPDVAATYLSIQDKAGLPRILQFSSEDRFTKYEICELFAQIMGLTLEGMEPNAQGNDPNASVQRPYDCHLSTRALQELGIDVATQDFVGWWRREMRAYRK